MARSRFDCLRKLYQYLSLVQSRKTEKKQDSSYMRHAQYIRWGNYRLEYLDKRFHDERRRYSVSKRHVQGWAVKVSICRFPLITRLGDQKMVDVWSQHFQNIVEILTQYGIWCACSQGLCLFPSSCRETKIVHKFHTFNLWVSIVFCGSQHFKPFPQISVSHRKLNHVPNQTSKIPVSCNLSPKTQKLVTHPEKRAEES